MSQPIRTVQKEVIFSGNKSLFTVFRSTMPAEKSMFYEHRHTAFEITMVLNGSGVYATNATEFQFQSGDIFFFSTDEYHWLKNLDSITNFLNIHFEPRFIWSDNYGFSGKELMKLFFNRKKNPLNKLNRQKDSVSIIQNLLYAIETEAKEQKPEYETLLKTHLINILVEMLRSYDGKLSNDDVLYSSHTLHHMENVLNYIEENLETDLTLEELSSIAHLSKTYFCRQFRELNGIPPWEYITIKRIERAIHLLENTDLTRLEIALKCGYNNTANFYHAFKKVTGKNPGEYKIQQS